MQRVAIAVASACLWQPEFALAHGDEREPEPGRTRHPHGRHIASPTRFRIGTETCVQDAATEIKGGKDASQLWDDGDGRAKVSARCGQCELEKGRRVL